MKERIKPPTVVAATVGGQSETLNFDGKTLGLTSNYTAESYQIQHTSARQSEDSFFTASGTSPTQENWRDICQRCGLQRLFVAVIPVYCIEGRLEFAPLCGSCMTLMRLSLIWDTVSCSECSTDLLSELECGSVSKVIQRLRESEEGGDVL